jgi:hypothetical protein
MATIASSLPSAERRERLFFLVMALFIVTSVITGFGLFYLAGMSSFGAPWWVHVHALTFMTWVGLYVAQNTLVFRDDIPAHRKLGRFMAAWAGWMLVVGFVLTALTVNAGRFPPLFTAAFFLALDWVNISVFVGLLIAAILLRRRTDWHRRLMLCATLCVLIPAWGRLLILSGAPPTALVLIAPPVVCMLGAMTFDQFNRRSIHPAYFWGVGSQIGMALAINVLAKFPPFAELAARIAA